MTAVRRRSVSTRWGAGGAVRLATTWRRITSPALTQTSVSLGRATTARRVRTASTPRAASSAVMAATPSLRTISAAGTLTSVRTPPSVRIRTENVSIRRGTLPVSVFHPATMLTLLRGTVSVTRDNWPQSVRPAAQALSSSGRNTGPSVRIR